MPNEDRKDRKHHSKNDSIDFSQPRTVSGGILSQGARSVPKITKRHTTRVTGPSDVNVEERKRCSNQAHLEPLFEREYKRRAKARKQEPERIRATSGVPFSNKGKKDPAREG